MPAILGNDAAALLDAYGVEDAALDDLDLTPGLIGRARTECVSSRGFEQKEHRKLSSLSIGSAHAF